MEWRQALLNLYAWRCLSDKASMHLPCLSNTTPVANQLASTHAFNSSPDTLQLPWTGSSQVTLISTSSMTSLREASSTGSSHFLVMHLFRTPAIMHSQLQTEKWPTNFPHMENTVRHVISAGGSGIAVPHFQHKVSCSPQTLRPSTLALCFRHSESLQVRPKDSNFTLTSSTDITSSFTCHRCRMMSPSSSVSLVPTL